jgi:putative ABC transport system substrate-binding protein
LNRRRFSVLLAGTAGWPTLAGAQRKPLPVIGFLYAGGRAREDNLGAFRKGLAEAGYIDGQTVAFEYRWGDQQYDLAALAAELVALKVDVIATIGIAPWAAKRATSTIPIVFGTGGDPMAIGLVTSLARPEANLTGVSYLVADLGSKRLDLLSQLIPQTRRIAVLANPANTGTERSVREMQDTARPRGFQLVIANARQESEIEAAFETMVREGCGGVVIQADPFIHAHKAQLLALAARHALPAIYTWRDFAEDGGLMAYGPSLTAVYHQVGVYVARILKGAKPSDLPIVLPDIFDFVINQKTAKSLGLSVPPALAALADQIIE